MIAHDMSDGNTGKPVSVLSGERSTAEIEIANDRNRRVAADRGREAATDLRPGDAHVVGRSRLETDRTTALDPAMLDVYSNDGEVRIAIVSIL